VTVGAEAGLAHESVVNCDNTFLLGRVRLVRRLGMVDSVVLDAVCEALAEAVGCNS
jgi:mRNA-degrading endonuclease toxin of MazEF toxin-antitoxin module